VIGVVLASRQDSLLRMGHSPVSAFLSGYRLGLVVAAILVAAGGVAAFFGLPRPQSSSVSGDGRVRRYGGVGGLNGAVVESRPTSGRPSLASWSSLAVDEARVGAHKAPLEFCSD